MTKTGRREAGGAANVLVLLLLAIAGLRVVSTYPVFSETADEHHFVAGLEWWDRGMYTYTIYHPPLARIASALPLSLSGARSHGLSDIVAEKNAVLYGAGGYVRNLALARLGILPFLLVAIIVVFRWTRRLAGDAAGLVAVLFFSSLPPVLAHSGLTTTDAPLMATLTLALFSFCLWLEQPTPGRTLLLAGAGALAILSKFSALPFFAWSAVAILLTRALVERSAPPTRAMPGRRIALLAGAAVLVAILVWAGYRFSWGTFPAVMRTDAREILVGPEAAAVAGVHVPAPEFWEGLRRIRAYVGNGHPGYLLGRYSFTGWWYYFPVALAVKTPLAFLILLFAGGAVLIVQDRARRDWRVFAPIAAALAILVSSLASHVAIGVRHILPVYPLLSIAAGCGFVRLWKGNVGRGAIRAVAVALLGWHLFDSARAHPDYLAHFNELAGRHPDRVLLDSNLDWGQDLLRLSRELQARKVDSIALAYFGNADLSRHGLPPIRPLPPDHPTTGWIAISEMWLKDVRGQGKAYQWLRNREPVATVGRSIRLYFIAPVPDAVR